ncbi:MAG: hypothetical protein ACREQN_05505 [Candidatus Binataceae bacterium]
MLPVCRPATGLPGGVLRNPKTIKMNRPSLSTPCVKTGFIFKLLSAAGEIKVRTQAIQNSFSTATLDLTLAIPSRQWQRDGGTPVHSKSDNRQSQCAMWPRFSVARPFVAVGIRIIGKKGAAGRLSIFHHFALPAMTL